ncbi:tetratricopeptide repeat protein [Mangrovimonas spongiae]|uniref:Tetratricopeptide repeat protein n=1 Tax=Mangrovimonas spongiae TaxID=2494697 RepID=A0A3R9MBI8_9FLAO|nr:tetratricopeptide repeat protein [Mangrovimonas spongiae]RSK41868.1 tetratricopeptide repeat protein [Mangrovimonas spongiae]
MSRVLLLCLLICFKAEAQTSALSVADSLYAHGKYSQAITVYKSDTLNPATNLKIAKSYEAIGNYDKALKYYQKGLTKHNLLSRFNYVKLLFKTKQYTLAKSQLEALIALDSVNPNYHYQLGVILEATNDTTAINKYQTAYKLDSTHQKAIYKIARELVKTRQFDKANKVIDEGLMEYANNISLISLKAQNLYYKEYYEQAQQWFHKLLDLGEQSEFIYEKLSLCYAKNFHYKEAITYRQKTLKYNPQNANAMFVIGSYYEQLQDYENAKKYIEQALLIKDQPLDFEYQKLAMVYNRLKKYDKAIDAYKKAIKEDPDRVDIHFFMLLSKERYYADIDAKIKLYEDFIKRFPNEKNFVRIANRRLQELKEEKFMSETD